MSRRPLGEVAMSVAERSRRKREKAKALREAVLTPDVVAFQANGSEASPIAAPPVVPRDGHKTLGALAGHDYPRMLYHPDGRTIVVATPEHHDRLTPDGWDTVPYPVHRQRPVWHHGIPQPNSPFARPLPRW